MNPERALELAKHQRPGVRLVVGPTEARGEPTWPLPSTHHLPGDPSWRERDLRRRLGFVPSLWAQWQAAAAECLGHKVTVSEWRWLCGPVVTAESARQWQQQIVEAWMIETQAANREAKQGNPE